MRCEPLTDGWRRTGNGGNDAGLVLYFGARGALEQGEHFASLRRQFPKADIAGCSTSGQILDGDVSDAGAVGVAIGFEATRTKLACVDLPSSEASAACGRALGQALAAPGLRSVFVLADGIGTNASGLIAGLVSAVGRDVPITGGLAGDGAAFAKTLVGGNCVAGERKAVAIGFYGERFQVGHGSDGGWKVFGPPRQITRSSNNILYELDGKPALDLYKHYLGEEAERLPASALLFPLKIWNPQNPEQDVVRTIVGVNEADRSLVFAGDVPVGYQARLMRGSHENLVQGAENAARAACSGVDGRDQIGRASCWGRVYI